MDRESTRVPSLALDPKISYSLYIWQQLFLGFGVTFRPFGFFSVFPVNIVSAVVVACLSYYLMERPLMRLGHRLGAAPSAVRSSVAEARSQDIEQSVA